MSPSEPLGPSARRPPPAAGARLSSAEPGLPAASGPSAADPPAGPAAGHPVPEHPRWLIGDDEEVPVRPVLTRRRIVKTALSVVEKHGLDALTMRRVASALKVTPMSLYNHVADKAELVDLMVDFIIGDVVAQSATDTGDWEAKLRAQARRNHQVWRDHPGFVRVYAEGVTLGPNGLANMDWAIGLLREAGFDEEEAAGAFLLLYRWSMATLLVGRARPASRNHQQPPPSPPRSKQERMQAIFAALPIEEIPNIEATMAYLSGTDIELGLDIIIAGLKARLAAKLPVATDAKAAG